MVKLKNPFDNLSITKEEKPLYILINSDSFKSDIKQRSINIKKLCRINQLDEICIVFTPTDDKELEKIILEELNCEVGSYKTNDNFIILSYLYFSSVVKVLFNESFENQLEKIKESNLNAIDMEIIYDDYDGLFDYIVISNQDILKVGYSSKVFSVNEIMEIIRLYMLNKNLFYIKKHYTIDETFYYIYRYKNVFREYQRVWESTFQLTDISNWTDSLGQRFEFYCRASDQTKIECLKTPNNSNASRMKYNFGYLILIMTGIYDNLAWIISKVYNLKINKNKVTLKVRIKSLENNKLDDFLECLKDKDESLVNHISDPINQQYIHLLYPIRDALVHREFLTSVHFSNMENAYERNLVQIPKEINDRLKKLPSYNNDYANCLFTLGDKVFIEPYKFIILIENIFENLVNSILAKLNINGILKQSTNQEEYKYDKDKLHEMLGLGDEPLYF